MKYLPIAILASVLPMQFAVAGEAPSNTAQAMSQMNKAGYVDLGIHEESDVIVVYGEKDGKKVSLVFEKGSFDLKTRKVEKVAKKKSQKLPRSMDEVERDTIEARARAVALIAAGASKQDIAEAVKVLDIAEDEETDFRAILTGNAKAPAKEKGTSKAKAKAKTLPRSMDEVERDTIEARARAIALVEAGASAEDIAEAVHVLDVAEDEETDFRAILSGSDKAPVAETDSKPAKGKVKALPRSMDEVERDTIEARERVADLREADASDDDIAEAVEVLDVAEDEETDFRAIAAGKK